MPSPSEPAVAASDGAQTASRRPAEGPPPSGGEARDHLRWGWTAVLVFVTLGLVLEALHAFKVGAYLDADHATRRLMWRLTHAHGTLLGLLNLAFAATAGRLALGAAAGYAASLALRGATLLMPMGFFLGGIWLHGGDPGLGVLLVPVGGVLLVVASALCARAAWAVTR